MIVYLFDRAFKLMKKAPVSGCFVEFGVYRGASLIRTIKMAKKYLGGNQAFYGFDSFEGIPPTKAPMNKILARYWSSGTFSDTSLELVRQKLKRAGLKAKLIKGDFNKLKPFSHYGIKKIRFAHIDADTYEGYRDALAKITPYVQVGAVMIFDEYITPSDYRFQEIRFHGRKAVDEWERKTGFNLHLIRFKMSCALCVIVDEQYLKKYGFFIELLRNDNIIQSLMDLLYQMSHRLRIKG